MLEAPPGAGKTTRVPLALLEGGFAEAGEILVLQPRRLPTRLAATRVAEELGERPGGRVGYQMRYETVAGRGTRLRFLTEGSLTRRLIADPELRGVSMVILDELHERHLATDLALALLDRLRRTRRPDLKIVAMSATLDGEGVAAYLETDALLRSEGRSFEVEIEHLERPDPRRLHQQVAGAIKRLLAAGLDGHVLVFLPGSGDIRRAAAELEPLARDKDLLVLPLHGSLPPQVQDRALAPSARRKIILSTNVAETSVTIDGIAAVVDSGLAHVAGHSPFSGLPTLRLEPISQASATQRAGRAGRTRAGKALRLYTVQDYHARPAHGLPAIVREDLTETVLTLRGIGVDPASLRWLDPPPAAALEEAEELLRRLEAVDAGGAPTEVGRRLLRFPVHPRLGRWIVAGEEARVAEDACLLAAIASEQDLRARRWGGGPAQAHTSGPSDLLDLKDRFADVERRRFDPGALRGAGLEARGVEAVRRARDQLRSISGAKQRLRGEEADERLLEVILSGFPDRVARRRGPRSRELLLSRGGTATLAEESVVDEAPLLVAVAADERGERGSGKVVVRLASAIEPEWLLDREGIGESDELVWNQDLERVERWSRITYGSVTLDESRGPAAPGPATSAALVEAAVAKGMSFFLGEAAWKELLARLALARAHLPELEIPDLDDQGVAAALAVVAEGMRSFDDLRALDLREALLAFALGPRRHLLDEQLPPRLTLPGGRRVPIHYETGQPPWIEARIQDFFGMTQTPTLLGGRLPLTLHLLAPNQRAVQVTQDLAGFWERHYPPLRRELGRRYPKHAWPEDGRTATPPQPRGGHRGKRA